MRNGKKRTRAEWSRLIEEAQASGLAFPAMFSVNGCRYRMFDEPGALLTRGQTFVIIIKFNGQIIDICNNNKIVKEKSFELTLSGGVSASGKMSANPPEVK